ncbi:MAG: PilZ domain-containing protein [Myxococcales bacterium]|nr:PilZ domain-containing protein [Myxococcales bacterium]
MSEEFHHFPAVVDLAVIPVDHEQEGDEPIGPPPRGAPLADRARATAARVGRANLEIRDAMWSIIDALAGLERTVDRLTRLMTLKDAGVELRRELVHIGGDGLELQRAGPWPDGQPVDVHLSIDLRAVHHLMSIRGVVDQRSNGAHIQFTRLREEERDLLVAFVFQQEAKERRRARSADC